jgi:acetyl-CoA decarbonylase/synthase complex subunit gamma
MTLFGNDIYSFIPVAICGAVLFLLWRYLRARKPPPYPDPIEGFNAYPIIYSPFDYLKGALSVLFLFMTVWWEKPGLYYTGRRDVAERGPLLVTANNFLTLFLLGRALGNRAVRILVIDTAGINVWCSAGEGRFSAEEIIDKARKAGLAKGDKKEKIVVPKFSLPGVKLDTLRENGFAPRIGPFYASDLPSYLDSGKLTNMIDDRVVFDFGSRLMTAFPTAMQFFFYFLTAHIVTLGLIPIETVWIAVGIAFTYPLLFPALPGEYFAVKGVSMAILVNAVAIPMLGVSGVDKGLTAAFVTFVFATSIFIGLSYTGNSAVSNYTSVRRETTLFLPLTVILYILAVGIYFLH